jgi:intracellular sulfur oxidation DsrE/DsrF family protein
MQRLHAMFLAVIAVAAIAFFAGARPISAEPQTDPHHPAIAGYGRIVSIPGAMIPPAAGHRVIFDVTEAGEPAAVNPGLEAVARYVNLLAAEGLRLKNAPVVVVMHGDATVAALDDAAYHVRHDRTNPNAALVAQLAAQGVKLYVCGQALASHNVDPKQIVAPIEVANNAVSVLAAFQLRRYALVPR